MAVEAQLCSGNYGISQDMNQLMLMMSSSGSGFDGLNGLCFDHSEQQMFPLQQQQQQQQQKLQRWKSQNLDEVDVSCVHQFGFTEITSSVGDWQRREIDHYINSQYEKLRLTVLEQRKRDYATVLNRIEFKSRQLLQQKDEELTKARNRAAQLEFFLLRAQTEQQQWQKIAIEREAQTIHLNNTIELMQYNSSVENNNHNILEEDVESCCDALDAMENKVVGDGFGLCRSCRCREVSVVFFPCRHLCACRECGSVLGLCPVCDCGKQGVIEALIS